MTRRAVLPGGASAAVLLLLLLLLPSSSKIWSVVRIRAKPLRLYCVCASASGELPKTASAAYVMTYLHECIHVLLNVSQMGP